MLLPGMEKFQKNNFYNVYVDEVKYSKQRWHYIGMLAINKSYENNFFNFLNDTRKKCDYFGEIKFYKTKKKNGPIIEIALSWIQEFNNHFLSQKEGNDIYFHVLGIDSDKICFDKFGANKKSEEYYNVYSRFFRTALKGLYGHYLKHKTQSLIANRICNVFHDSEGYLENKHAYFKRQLQKAMIEDSEIAIENKNIIFINSNHNEEPLYKTESIFIQFVDLITGTIAFCLDGENFKYKGRNEIASEMMQTLPKLIEPQSYSYNYNISFFPSEKIKKYYKDIEKHGTFYKKRAFAILSSANYTI